MDKKLDTLIARAQSGDESAFSDLTEQYKPLLFSMSKNYFDKLGKKTLAFEDFLQEARMGLYSAVCTYKNDGKVTFGLYSKVCVRNRLVSLLRSENRKNKKAEKQRELNEPSYRLIEKEDLAVLESKIKSTLSKLEWEVFCLYIEKKSYIEIAERLGKSTKSVDNAICRIKSKLKGLKKS